MTEGGLTYGERAQSSREKGTKVRPEKMIAAKCPEFMAITNSKSAKKKSEEREMYMGIHSRTTEENWKELKCSQK